MTPHHPQTFERRQFLRTASALVAGTFGAALARADELPRNMDPRAISGDTVQPDWGQRVTITVGPKEADLAGATDRVIQAAVDYVARLGGGTVRILPGTYRMRNSVFLQSKVRLLGSGTDSVLVKEASVTTKLIVDGDHWDQEVTLAEPKGFQVGDGVRLVSKDPYGKGTNIVQRTLIASSGNRFKLDLGFAKELNPRSKTRFTEIVRSPCRNNWVVIGLNRTAGQIHEGQCHEQHMSKVTSHPTVGQMRHGLADTVPRDGCRC